MRLARLAALVLLLHAGCAPTTSTHADELRVATWNLEWFFDHDTRDNFEDLPREQSAPSRADFDWKVREVAEGIAMLEADVVALQEIENARVLERLAVELRSRHGLDYKACFVEGTDTATEQDVGVLTRTGLSASYSRFRFTRDMRSDRRLKDVSKHLWLQVVVPTAGGRETVNIVCVHLYASDVPPRQAQARTLRRWLDDHIRRGENVIVLGDMNTAVRFNETRPETDIGILRGLSTRSTGDDLTDLHERLGQRETHLSGRELDRILVSQSLTTDTPNKLDLSFRSIQRRADASINGRLDRDHRTGYWEINERERDASDHWPIVAEFEWK